MIAAAALAALAIISTLGAWRLNSARWATRAPHTAVLLWQALGVTWGLAATGALLAYAFEPYGKGALLGMRDFVVSAYTGGEGGTVPLDLPRVLALISGMTMLSVLIAVLVGATFQTLRARRRHRMLLALIAREDPGVPGVRVVDHPGAAAYCVPGLRSQVVVSAGTLALLSPDELRAVLAHESAHARERHDLVLLPFAALCRAMPFSGVVRGAQSSVELLIEMAADDRAREHCSPRRLATALLRFGAAAAVPTPSGALGAHTGVMARVERLISPVPILPKRFRFLVMLLAATLTVSAPLLWLLPS
ncbi:Zn-dependent protease with chaperone function [Sinosporangium album]|uniref:Zn-dependent protease with chaperone function n=1 Tax=Sinosporangium album TaxID=504805 RepID=A0A1G8JYY7_9ACTN|nr:M56 family metallopeptidase [Sinosporangium album]SDI36388.1 Zn-dependent protease with chaperone function [Sinosporangium album]